MSSSITKNFNANIQKKNQQVLARFIEICVRNAQTADWMPAMIGDCLCVLCENNATTMLVAETMVGFYFQVVIKRHNETDHTPFWYALGRVRERIYQFIVHLNDDSHAIDEILSGFFKRINANPEVIPYDNQGMGEIVGKFFSVATLNVNLKVLSELLAFDKKHQSGQGHGANLLKMCANQPAVINGLTLIICDVYSVRAQRLALELATEIQRLNFVDCFRLRLNCNAEFDFDLFFFFLSLIPNRLFQDEFYKGCLLSDDQKIRNNVADLYRVSFRVPGTDDAAPQEILRHAIQLYREYRVSN